MRKLSPDTQRAADEICDLIINECPANVTLLAGRASLAYRNDFLRSAVAEMVHRMYMQRIGMGEDFTPLEKLGVGLLQAHMEMHGTLPEGMGKR